MEDGEGSIKWTRLGRRELLRCPIFTVAERENEGPGGRKGRFIVLEAPDWATVVPIVRRGEEDCFLMVRQYRHGSDELSLEFPGGVVEKGEDPAAAAARELAEETGYTASSIRLAGSVYPNPAFQPAKTWIELSRDGVGHIRHSFRGNALPPGHLWRRYKLR